MDRLCASALMIINMAHIGFQGLKLPVLRLCMSNLHLLPTGFKDANNFLFYPFKLNLSIPSLARA